MATVFILTLDHIPVIADLMKVVAHDSLVEALLLRDVFLVPLHSLPPCNVLRWIVILNHTEVLLRHDIATIVQGFHLSGHHW